MKKGVTLLGLVFLLLGVPVFGEDLSPEVRDFLNDHHRLILASPTQEGMRSTLERALADWEEWDKGGFNDDELRESQAFRIEAEAALGELSHPPLAVPDLLPTPMADGLVYLLMNEHSLGTPDDIGRWIGFLEQTARAIEQSVEYLRQKEKEGVLYPRVVLTQIARSIDPYLWTPAANGRIATYFRSQVADEALRARVVGFLETKLYPALKTAKKAVDDLATRASSTYSLCVDPQSYGALIYQRLGEKVPAAVLHAQALAALKTLEADVDSLVPPGSGRAFTRVQAFLKTEPVLMSEDLDWANHVLAETKTLLPLWFSARPPEFEVRFQTADPVPNYARESEDGHRPARLNLPQGTMAKSAAALGLLWHEGPPGHAFQIGLQRNDLTLPLFRRDPWPTSFTEGWAVYAETLMAGSPRGADPYYRASLWMDQYNRALMVALDTGVNGLGWTYKEAQSFLLKAQPGESRGYDGEINRVIYWPGQLLAYDYGHRQIVSLLEETQRAQGADFDLKAFHDRLLTLGSLPFPLIHRAFLPILAP